MADLRSSENRSFDLDSGGGTDYVEGSAIAVAASGGAIAVGGLAETTITVLGVGGGTAHDAVDAGYPLKIGGKGVYSTPTAVGDNDRVNALFDRYGILAVSLAGISGVWTDTSDYHEAWMRDPSGETSRLGVLPMLYTGSAQERARSLAALDAAPNVDVGIQAIGVGPGWDRKRDPVGVAANSTASVVVVVVDGAAAIAFNVTTIGTTPGSMILQTTSDDSTWVTADRVFKVGTGWITGSFVPAVGDEFIVMTAGTRQVRYKVNAAYASGTATVKWTAAHDSRYIVTAGDVAHDAVDSGYPGKIGGYAKAAAPSDVSSDGDRVNAWFLRNGAQATVITAAGALIGGDATNGLDVDVTRISGSVAVTGTFWQATQPVSGTVSATTAGDVAHDGVDSGNPVKIGGYAKAAAPTDVSADADRVNAWFLRNGAQATVLTAAGALVGGDAANGLDVDVTRVTGTVTVNQVAGATSIAKAEDVASADADVGVPAMAVRKATPANTSGTDGDYEMLQMSAGRLWTSVLLEAGTNTNEIVGDVAQDAAIAGNPVGIGFRASTAIPTAMSADGDIVYPWANRSGAPVVTTAPGVGLNSDPFNLKTITAQYTTTQTGTALLTPTSGKKMVVISYQIQVGGTTAGTVQLWWGGSADTTYTRGTDRAIFDGEFAPSSTLKPGVVQTGVWISGTADDVLRVTDSAAINPITFTVWYYEI